MAHLLAVYKSRERLDMMVPEFGLPDVPDVFDECLDLVCFAEVRDGDVHHAVGDDKHVGAAGQVGEQGLRHLGFFGRFQDGRVHPVRLEDPALLTLSQVGGQPQRDLQRQARLEGAHVALRTHKRET